MKQERKLKLKLPVLLMAQLKLKLPVLLLAQLKLKLPVLLMGDSSSNAHHHTAVSRPQHTDKYHLWSPSLDHHYL